MRLLVLLQLLVLAALQEGAWAVESPPLRSCTTLALEDSISPPGACFRFEEGNVALKQDLEIIGQADGSTVWDMEWRAGALSLGGHSLKLVNITIARTLLMWQTPRELVPMFIDVHTEGSSISLENVTFHMIGRCDILQLLMDGFDNIAFTSANGSSLSIPSSSRGVARGTSITVQCDTDGRQPAQISFVASDASQVLSDLSTFAQTRINEATFNVAVANISLQDADWPDGSDSIPEIFNHLLVQGSPVPSVGRLPVLDFGLHAQIMRIERGDALVHFQSLILTNLIMKGWSDAAARDPLALFSMSFHGFKMPRNTGEHLIVQDCTIVVSVFELKSFIYWGILVRTDGTPHITRLAPYIQDLRLDRIITFPKRDGTLIIWEITNLRAVTFRNVIVTTEYPEQAPPRLQPIDENFGPGAPAIYTTEYLPIVEARNGSTFLQALLDTSRDSQLLEDPDLILSTPRVVYLTTDLAIQSQPGDQALASTPAMRESEGGTALAEDFSSVNVTWPPQRVVLENSVIIETIEGQRDSSNVQNFHTLNMGFVPELLEIRDRPSILQYLFLTDIYAPCVRDDCEADSSGQSLLPAFFLWPIQFNRSRTLLYIDNCSMALPPREFDGMLKMARAGSQWEQNGGPFSSFFTTFQAQSASANQVNIQTFAGSGVQGTHVNITVHPCDTSECQRHEARAKALAGSTLSPDNNQEGGNKGSGGSSARVLGPAIAVPVGVVLLSVLGVLLFFLIRRRRPQEPSGRVLDKSSREASQHAERVTGPSIFSSTQNPLADAGSGDMLWRQHNEALDRFSVRSSSELPGAGEHDPEETLPSGARLGSRVIPDSRGSRGSYKIGSRAASGRHVSMCLSLSSGMPSEPVLQQEQSPGEDSLQQASPLREIQQLVHQLKADHLVIQRQLGQGGFGTVYQGLWRNLPVAVKIVLFSSKPVSHPATNKDTQGDPEAAMLEEALHALGQEHAILEAAVTSAITHPNVVTTYHYDISEIRSEDVQGLRGLQVQANPSMKHWKLYLVQEFMEAGTLSDAIHRHRFFHSEDGLPFLDFVVQVLMDVAHGMAYVHSRSIIHGDLNPNNILLSVDTSKLSNVCAKIADFGACHLLQHGRLHVSNVQVGTPFYMDPLIRATGRSSSASDVYSFGVIMWEMFRGNAPFARTPAGHLVQASGYPRYPPGAPQIYEELTLQCLNAKAGKRPSFDHCLQVLAGLQDSLARQAT